MEASRTLKANPKLAGQPCGWCQISLALGDDTSVCTACEGAHHHVCWNQRAGCAKDGCINAPLRQLEPAVVAHAHQPRMPDGFMACPMCREMVAMSAGVCPFCRAITSPDGVYRGPMTNAPGATAALVYGILGLFICNIILGPIAIIKANNAKAAIAADPTLKGAGMATAGTVLGIIDICLFVIYLLIKFGGSSSPGY